MRAFSREPDRVKAGVGEHTEDGPGVAHRLRINPHKTATGTARYSGRP